MRRITAVLASACLALALAGAASSTTFGVADDAGKYAEDGGASFFNMLTELGMTENRMAVFWDPANPTTIVDQAFLDRAIPQAMRRGIEVIFAIYPLKARALVDTPNGVELFAEYAAKVAERYPYVRKIICLNEGNQPRFHQPQFDDVGNGISGGVQEQAMAACYDALMACDPDVALLNFFHAVDETNLSAWQSGVVLPDGTHRASFNAVKDAILANQSCHGKLAEWRHAEHVVGAQASFRTLPRSFVVRADDGFSYEVTITRPSSTRRLTGAAGAGEAARDVLFKLPKLRRGAYRVRIVLRAETNPDRETVFTRTFSG